MFGHRCITVKGANCGLDALFLVIITSIAGFLFGYDIGQISGILFFRNFKYRFLHDDSATIKSLIVSFMSIGCLFGSLLGAYSSDWLGRRKSIALGVAFFLAGDVIQITATDNWLHVSLGRFIAGLGIGNLSVGVPMFQSECVPREIRGAVVTSYQLLITIGILFGNLICFFMRAYDDHSFASKVPKTRYRTFLGMGIHFLQQWTGINYFFYYGTTVFSNAKINDPFMTQLILGAVNVLWQAAWLLVFASIGIVDHHPSPTFSIVMIISACMFIASFAATWGPIAWVVMGETFALRTRAKQAALATASNWLGNFLIGLLTPYADYSISYYFGFILAGANVFAALLVWFYLYESTLLSLESVDIMYSINDLAPWESARWVPPGYVTRRERDEQHFRRVSISTAADMSSLTQEMVDMANKEVVVNPKAAAV
ncbi:high-affinity fructose transporter ght6 [Trichoderma asperellum]|uniref:High-affinity fructose transporter ght6 n=1 Tax=Trichoderma asperellum TaxID=101201 RepID=A0A6V8R0P6_TRIAP|nr:high-affinity fructose transporter ght6 [Trichoderma asperellum]